MDAVYCCCFDPGDEGKIIDMFYSAQHGWVILLKECGVLQKRCKLTPQNVANSHPARAIRHNSLTIQRSIADRMRGALVSTIVRDCDR